MKILYVSQYFPPEMGAPAARASELSFHWAQMGHQATVLTGFPNHPTGEVHAEYRGKLRRLVMHETAGGVKVVRTWLLPLPNRRGYERMMNYGSFCVSAGITGRFLPRPDVVIATSPQLLVGLAGWAVARAQRVPFIFEVRDLWPESLAAVGMGKPDSLLHRALGKIAGFLYRECNRIVVVTPAFKDHLIRNWGIAAERISIVENGVESDLFSPGSRAPELRERLRSEGQFVVGYIGTMGMAHGLETLLEAATRIRDSPLNILFLLVGEGAEKERIISMIASRGLRNVRVVGQQPRERIPEYIRACDVCLVLLKKTELFKTVIPTKMLEFMSCGRPLIVGVDGEARRIVEQAKSGLFIEPENVEALSRAILQLAENASLCEEFGRNGRHAIVQNFSRQKTASDYLGILGDIIDQPQQEHAAVV